MFSVELSEQQLIPHPEHAAVIPYIITLNASETFRHNA